jgi:hypothetical protein
MSPLSARWLRSWKSSARSYNDAAADFSSCASCTSGWPAAQLSAAPAYGSDGALVGRDAGRLPDVLALRFGERLEHVGRVVELHELGRGLDDLGLGDPLAASVVEDAAPAAERTVRGDGEVIVVVIDERHATELADPVALVVHEPLELLAGTDEEVRPFERCFTPEVDQERVPTGFHWRTS